MVAALAANGSTLSGQMVIADVSPSEGTTGAVVTITGSGFGNVADNLGVVVRNGSRSIPLQVIQAQDNQIRARLGPVLDGAEPGLLTVARGRGAPGRFVPETEDVFVQAPVWVWNRLPTGGPEAVSTMPFVPQPFPPVPRLLWLFGEAPADGTIRLELTNRWVPNSIVEIRARAHNDALGSGHGMTAFGIRLLGGGSTLECGERICSALRNAFLQQANVRLNCDAVEVEPGRVELTLGLPDANIDWGNFDICVTPPPEEPPPVPVISGFSPLEGGPGTRIIITGEHFGAEPDALSVFVPSGTHLTALHVVEAADGRIVAEVGPVAPGALAGPLVVAFGESSSGVFSPTFDDVSLEEPVRVWRRSPADRPVGVSADTFLPTAEPSPADVSCFFGGPDADGTLRLALRGEWRADSLLSVEARAHRVDQGLGNELLAASVRFGGEGSALDCALRVCDVIATAFLERASVAATCEAQQVGDDVEITVGFPGMSVDEGSLVVCVSPLAVRPLSIDSFLPAEGEPGTLVEIRGGGFGTDPNNVSVSVLAGSRSIPLHVIDAGDTVISARLGFVPPNSEPGPLVVTLGNGSRSTVDPGAADVVLDEPLWVWRRDPPAGPQVASEETFRPLPTARPPINQTWFFSQPPADGRVSVTLSGDWLADSNLAIAAAAGEELSGSGHALMAPLVRLLERGTAMECAAKICGVVRSAFSQSGVEVDCAATALGEDRVEINFSVPGLNVDQGYFDISVFPLPDDQGKPLFVRGDVDSSGTIDLTDGISLLGWLFLGQSPPACIDAADANDTGGNRPDLSDAVFIFNWLFVGGSPPPPPSPTSARYPTEDCELDPTLDDLDCRVFSPTCS
ncbi:MAG: IPT/TIG domain-containing protein [Planctomycetota bacterium]|nr:IPT/TIG domain-containing protein [Planctomycetota bacterium]